MALVLIETDDEVPMIDFEYIKIHKGWLISLFLIMLCGCVLLCGQDVRADEDYSGLNMDMEVKFVIVPQGYGKIASSYSVDGSNITVNPSFSGNGSAITYKLSELVNYSYTSIPALISTDYKLKPGNVYAEDGTLVYSTADPGKTYTVYTKSYPDDTKVSLGSYYCSMVPYTKLLEYIKNRVPTVPYLVFYLTVSSTDSVDKNITGAVITNASPAAWGTASGDKVASKVDTTTINAEPRSDQYEFDHWNCNGYYFSNQKSVTVQVMGAIDIYTAFFKEASDNGVYVEANDSTMGTVSGSTKRNVNGSKVNTTTITATSKDPLSYKFDHWELVTNGVGKGSAGTSSTLSVDVKDQKDVYTAIFVDTNYTVDVKASPTTGGTVTKVETTVDGKTKINITAASNTGYKIDHWELTRNGQNMGRIKGNETSYEFFKNDYDEIYTVFFVDESKNGVFTAVSPSGAGTAAGDKSYDSNNPNATTTLSATPTSTDWKFDHWELDGSKISETSPFTVKVKDEYDLYTAVFASQDKETGVYTQVSPSGAGTASGDMKRNVNGTKNSQTTLQAYPSSSDWVFDHWVLTSTTGYAEDVGKANPFTVNVGDTVDTYTAVFKGKGSITNPDVVITAKKTGITDEKYLNKWRSVTSPNYKNTRVAFTTAAHDFVATLGGKYTSTPASTGVPYAATSLKKQLTTSENKTTQEVFGLLTNGSKLVSSDAEEFSFTEVDSIWQYSTTAEGYVESKWGKKYSYDFVTSADVNPPEGFQDGTRTLIWSETGAKYKENLFIILDVPGYQTEFVTPVADYEGVLTFTVPAVTDARMILVKAYIK